MQVEVIKALVIQEEIIKEQQWLLNVIQSAPDSIRPEIRAIADKRDESIKAISGEIAKAMVSISEDAQKYIKSEAVDTKEFTPIAK